MSNFKSKYNYCVFIISYNRPNDVLTLDTLNKFGYDGDYYIVVDDKDPQLEIYKEKFKEKLLIFNKEEISKKFDSMDNFGILNGGVYPRLAINDLCLDVGVDCYLVLDDDYIHFGYKKLDNCDVLRELPLPKILNHLIEYMFDFLYQTNSMSVALAQAGDYIGGANGGIFKKGYSRKCMNTWFCRTDRPIKFIGHMNDDVNTYIKYGSIGKLFLTLGNVFVRQTQTQLLNGGQTELYIDNGTYIKSFYSKILMPSCVEIRPMGVNHFRLHHNIKWNNAVPKIIDERWKNER